MENQDSIICSSCSGENENKVRFCVHCGNPFPRKRGFPFKKMYLLFGIVGLILAGAIVSFSTGSLDSNLVGKVNGEGITRKDFSTRLERLKKIYESRYGQDLFQGEGGKENLNRLKTEILDEMTTEKILLQEARNAGYLFAPSEEIDKQVSEIENKYGVTENELKEKMGLTIEELKEHIQKGWIISQFLEKVVFKGEQRNEQSVFAEWFKNAKAKAKLETYEKLEPILTAKASCCGSGGGCGGGGRVSPLDPKIEKEARAKGLEYYEKKTQKKGASARVTNFGCHIQVDIIEDGKVVASLTYRQGEVEEI